MVPLGYFFYGLEPWTHKGIYFFVVGGLIGALIAHVMGGNGPLILNGP